MPRQAQLRRHKGYLCTNAGDPAGVYFGRIGGVSHAEAKRRFRLLEESSLFWAHVYEAWCFQPLRTLSGVAVHSRCILPSETEELKPNLS